MHRFNVDMKLPGIFLISFLFACNQLPDHDTELKAILNLQEQEEKAHINKDVGLFLSGFSKDMITVNRGVVSTFSVK